MQLTSVLVPVVFAFIGFLTFREDRQRKPKFRSLNRVTWPEPEPASVKCFVDGFVKKNEIDTASPLVARPRSPERRPLKIGQLAYYVRLIDNQSLHQIPCKVVYREGLNYKLQPKWCRGRNVFYAHSAFVFQEKLTKA